MSKGFIKLNRAFFDNHFWNEERTYSLAEAWLDLIQSARFEVAPKKDIVKMKIITIHRGELRASQRYLANRWNWSLGKVNRFFKVLENERMVERRNEHSETLVKLCNYERYNPIESSEMNTYKNTKSNRHKNTNGTLTEHQRNTNENKIKERKERKELKERKEEFRVRVFKFKDKHPPEILKKFFLYWSEENFEKQKMLWEMREVFNLKTRLDNWIVREKKYKNREEKPIFHTNRPPTE